MNKVLHDIFLSLVGRREFTLANIELDQWLYPISLDFALERESFYYYPRDAQGIPVREYQSVGRQYNPTQIATYGLAHWNRFRRTRREEHSDHFMKIAKWFSDSENSIWLYCFDWGDVKAPWVSCMAQGQGISVLVRAYVLTGDNGYLDRAQQALVPFGQPIVAGGVQSTLDNGDLFWEEYPLFPNSTHVLNGYLFAVIGMIELQRLLNLPLVDDFLTIAKNTLEHNLYRWDLGYWSAYSLVNEQGSGPRNACTASYHSLQISQLTFIGCEFESTVVNEIAENWLVNFSRFSSRLRALLEKTRYRFYDLPQR